MKLSKYGYIVRGDGYSPENHFSMLKSHSFSTNIIGVSSLEEAFLAADYLILNGVELIELCGGFDDQDYQQVIDHIDCSIPVGCVQFSESEQKKLNTFFSS